MFLFSSATPGRGHFGWLELCSAKVTDQQDVEVDADLLSRRPDQGYLSFKESLENMT